MIFFYVVVIVVFSIFFFVIVFFFFFFFLLPSDSVLCVYVITGLYAFMCYPLSISKTVVKQMIGKQKKFKTNYKFHIYLFASATKIVKKSLTKEHCFLLVYIFEIFECRKQEKYKKNYRYQLFSFKVSGKNNNHCLLSYNISSTVFTFFSCFSSSSFRFSFFLKIFFFVGITEFSFQHLTWA